MIEEMEGRVSHVYVHQDLLAAQMDIVHQVF